VIKFNLKEILYDRRMTQRQLWEAANVRPPTVSAMCTGSAKQIPVKNLDAICRVLNCQPGDLLEYIPDSTEGA